VVDIAVEPLYLRQKTRRHFLNRRLGELRNQSGRFWRREKSLIPTGNRTLDRPDRSPVYAVPVPKILEDA